MEPVQVQLADDCIQFPEKWAALMGNGPVPPPSLEFPLIYFFRLRRIAARRADSIDGESIPNSNRVPIDRRNMPNPTIAGHLTTRASNRCLSAVLSRCSTLVRNHSHAGRRGIPSLRVNLNRPALSAAERLEACSSSPIHVLRPHISSKGACCVRLMVDRRCHKDVACPATTI